MRTGSRRQFNVRAIQIDLDLVYDRNPVTTERNVDALLERVMRIQPNTVYLQAFADPDGDGNVHAVYFPNRVLPMRCDLLSRAARQFALRGVQVYVWMPVLSLQVPGAEKSYVQEWTQTGEPRISRSWYRRLSPFEAPALRLAIRLYEDLAAHVPFHGVVFQDDAYLAPAEDASPAAQRFYHSALGTRAPVPGTLSETARRRWTDIKIRRLNTFTERLMQAVRIYRPESLFARTLYAPVLLSQEAETQFAQSYRASLRRYDQVVVLAYPELERVRDPLPWLERLVDAASLHPNGLERTVFELQAYDWPKARWIDEHDLLRRARVLLARGALHVAYYPDDFSANRPNRTVIRREFSTEPTMWPARPKR